MVAWPIDEQQSQGRLPDTVCAFSKFIPLTIFAQIECMQDSLGSQTAASGQVSSQQGGSRPSTMGGPPAQFGMSNSGPAGGMQPVNWSPGCNIIFVNAQCKVSPAGPNHIKGQSAEASSPHKNAPFLAQRTDIIAKACSLLLESALRT